jgi:ABC-type histidine transport system ATPase subunit
VFVDQGRILEKGTPEEVIDHPKEPRVQAFIGKLSFK